MAQPPSPETLNRLRLDLAAADPALAPAHLASPPFEWRAREGGFPGLLRMVVEQQVSTIAAAAIWARVETGLGAVTPERVLELDVETLRSFGLSLPKARYAGEIARAQVEGRIDFGHLERLSDEEAIARLVAIKGVGPWTAEAFLMFCEGRLDVFPGGDIALQEAMRWADGLEARPNQAAAYARAERWRPYRAVAAHLLWAWYGAVKRGDASLEP
jgi:DNA-3-methyladenine glycosylase II